MVKFVTAIIEEKNVRHESKKKTIISVRNSKRKKQPAVPSWIKVNNHTDITPERVKRKIKEIVDLYLLLRKIR